MSRVDVASLHCRCASLARRLAQPQLCPQPGGSLAAGRCRLPNRPRNVSPKLPGELLALCCLRGKTSCRRCVGSGG